MICQARARHAPCTRPRAARALHARDAVERRPQLVVGLDVVPPRTSEGDNGNAAAVVKEMVGFGGEVGPGKAEMMASLAAAATQAGVDPAVAEGGLV